MYDNSSNLKQQQQQQQTSSAAQSKESLANKMKAHISTSMPNHDQMNEESGHPKAMSMSEEMRKAGINSFVPRTMGDRVARMEVLGMRYMFDVLTGYRRPFPGQEKALTENNWLNKTIMLETLAMTPLFAASIVRYWRSLGGLRQDKGWVHALLDDSENERMHLTNWMMVKRPNLMMRAFVLAQQAFYVPMFMFGYTFTPKMAYRAIGYIEEVGLTHYRLLLREIEREGSPVHSWNFIPAPQVSREYWNMGD